MQPKREEFIVPRVRIQGEELRELEFKGATPLYDYDELREMYIDLATVTLEMYQGKSDANTDKEESRESLNRALLELLYRDITVFCSTLEHYAQFNPDSIRFRKLQRFLELHRENIAAVFDE